MKISKKIAILYVDDEEANQFFFKINSGGNYHVYTASSGDEGLNILEENEDDITVVISDMKMPGMNGVEFIQKARTKYNDIAYFIVTGFSDNQEIEEAMKSKLIHQWFSKPYQMNQIQEAIQQALQRLE